MTLAPSLLMMLKEPNFTELNLTRMAKGFINITSMMLMAIKFIGNVEMLIKVT